MAVASRSTFGVAPGDGHENLRGWVDSMDGTFRLGKTTGPVTQRLYLRTTPRSFAQPRFAAASRTTTAGLDRHSLRARRSKPPPGSVNSPIC